MVAVELLQLGFKMSTKKFIDPELLAAFGGDPPILNVDENNLQEMRGFALEMMSSLVIETLDNVSITHFRASEVPVIIYRPENNIKIMPALLHIHSGGFILGNAASNEAYCRKMASDLSCIVISVDYRLAPEFPFPAALDDCYKALCWVWNHYKELSIDRKRIAITGESGGGGLAAQLAFVVRDRKEVEILFQFLVYPMLDNRTSNSLDAGEFTGEFFWTNSSNRFAWKSYLNDQYESPPYPAVPTQILNLSGLAPAYICVGTLDLFVQENIQYASCLARAGVSVEMHLYPGATHGFEFAIGTELSNKFFEERKRVFEKFFKSK